MTLHNIKQQFAVISPQQTVSIESADEALYSRLDHDYGQFVGHQLVACHAFEADWPTWEMHPHGDEIVILLSGCATMLLQTDQGEQSLLLNREGAYIVVPKGIWHTAKITHTATLLFITPGENTQNRQDVDALSD